MATHRTPILGAATLPDNSGNVWPEPASVSQPTNKRYTQLVWRFKDTGTKDALGGRFVVPQNYVGTTAPKMYVYWTSTGVTGNVEWDVAYAVVRGDNANSVDPAADTEAVSVTQAAPGTSQYLRQASVALTGSNLQPGDLVEFSLARNGASGSDTMAADAIVYGVLFEYSDS